MFFISLFLRSGFHLGLLLSFLLSLLVILFVILFVILLMIFLMILLVDFLLKVCHWLIRRPLLLIGFDHFCLSLLNDFLGGSDLASCDGCCDLRLLFVFLLVLLFQVILLLLDSGFFLHFLLKSIRALYSLSLFLLSDSDVLHFFSFLLTVGKFLELSNEEAVHVVRMGVDSASEVQGRVEPLRFVLGEAWLAHFTDTGIYKLHIAGFQSIVDNPLVFFD